MKIRIERFNEFGTKRRVHRHESCRSHRRLYVLWRSRRSRPSVDLVTGRVYPDMVHPTIVLTLETPCPQGTWRGHIRHCMGIGTTTEQST